jgi:hypothetical protein
VFETFGGNMMRQRTKSLRSRCLVVAAIVAAGRVTTGAPVLHAADTNAAGPTILVGSPGGGKLKVDLAKMGSPNATALDSLNQLNNTLGLMDAELKNMNSARHVRRAALAENW